jgi:hypothetical protein
MRNNLFVWLIVVLNPYENLDYDNPNVYYFDDAEFKIRVVTPEKEKDFEKKKAVKLEFCFLCDPPQYLPIEMEID